MSKLLSYFQAYTTNEEGATAIEYGLLAALIALAIVVTAGVFGDDLSALFTQMSAELTAAG